MVASIFFSFIHIFYSIIAWFPFCHYPCVWLHLDCRPQVAVRTLFSRLNLTSWAIACRSLIAQKCGDGTNTLKSSQPCLYRDLIQLFARSPDPEIPRQTWLRPCVTRLRSKLRVPTLKMVYTLNLALNPIGFRFHVSTYVFLPVCSLHLQRFCYALNPIYLCITLYSQASPKIWASSLLGEFSAPPQSSKSC